jgi:prepilin-type N-terminal cleavage/methylation domain-containing protein
MNSHAYCPWRRDKNSSRAFTLVEIVIVLLIVGILAAVAAPKYSAALSSFRLQAVADRIAGDIRYAKRMAQQNSATQTIAFDAAANSYTLAGMADANHQARTYQFSLADLEYDCDLVSADFGGSATLTFSVYGQPTSTGTVVVSCGGATSTLAIDSLGQVSIP